MHIAVPTTQHSVRTSIPNQSLFLNRMSQHFNHPSYEALYQACGRSGSGDEKEVKRILDEDPSLLNKVTLSAVPFHIIKIFNNMLIIGVEFCRFYSAHLCINI